MPKVKQVQSPFKYIIVLPNTAFKIHYQYLTNNYRTDFFFWRVIILFSSCFHNKQAFEKPYEMFLLPFIINQFSWK